MESAIAFSSDLLLPLLNKTYCVGLLFTREYTNDVVDRDGTSVGVNGFLFNIYRVFFKANDIEDGIPPQFTKELIEFTDEWDNPVSPNLRVYTQVEEADGRKKFSPNTDFGTYVELAVGDLEFIQEYGSGFHFAIFSKEEILILCALYNEIIVSGAKITTGTMTVPLVNTTTGYFTLKAEGVDPRKEPLDLNILLNISSNKGGSGTFDTSTTFEAENYNTILRLYGLSKINAATAPEEDSVATASEEDSAATVPGEEVSTPSVALAIPCPPWWNPETAALIVNNYFSAVPTSVLLSSPPAFNLKNLQNSWKKFIDDFDETENLQKYKLQISKETKSPIVDLDSGNGKTRTKINIPQKQDRKKNELDALPHKNGCFGYFMKLIGRKSETK